MPEERVGKIREEKNYKPKVNKMSRLSARLTKADGTLVTTAATENPGDNGVADRYLKIATSCWAQTIRPSLLRRWSFVLGLLYLLFIIEWQRWYLDIARKMKLLNACNVLSYSKILKPDGFAASCLLTKAGGMLCLPPSPGSAACWSPHGCSSRAVAAPR